MISVRRSSKFLSTPSVRRATAYSFICGFSTGISIHALREEGDLQGSGLCSQAGQISIHALREEGDNRIMSMLESPRLFLSTPSARRATRSKSKKSSSSKFLSTPSARRATRSEHRTGTWTTSFLSTPSVRRATPPAHWAGGLLLFLSTPSVRRATRTADFARRGLQISIYALREEGDRFIPICTFFCAYFYPRPPQGGRLAGNLPAGPKYHISTHALREEGDA